MTHNRHCIQAERSDDARYLLSLRPRFSEILMTLIENLSREFPDSGVFEIRQVISRPK
jgi:hypothetical protein